MEDKITKEMAEEEFKNWCETVDLDCDEHCKADFEETECDCEDEKN